MFYKEIGEDWIRGSIINLPDGNILNTDNRLEVDGWIWFDNPPQEYIDWEESQIPEDEEDIIRE